MSTAKISKKKAALHHPMLAHPPGADLCTTHPCGANAECSVKEQRATCECRSGYQGDPHTGCSPKPGGLNGIKEYGHTSATM